MMIFTLHIHSHIFNRVPPVQDLSISDLPFFPPLRAPARAHPVLTLQVIQVLGPGPAGLLTLVVIVVRLACV